ncbi:MAG: sigma-70 family RNA polymerase sigma factor [bacterium]|nr:sigma-70 family RNA polymerase sigma factor [bacterium]
MENNEEYINEFIQGNEQAFVQLMNTYSNRLGKYCYNILGNYHDAEDVVQITFIKLYQKRKNIKNTQEITGYLYRIAYTTSIDLIRKRKFLLIPMKEQYEKPLISEELFQALMTLKPQERSMIYNKIVEEMTYKEMSSIYKKSEAALRKQVERSKKKLKNLLGSSHCCSLVEEVVK